MKLGGVWCEGRVGGRRIVEPSTQRQVFSKKLHIVLYPLKRRSGLLRRIGSELSRLWQVSWVVGEVCWGVGKVRWGKQEGRVTGQQ